MYDLIGNSIWTFLVLTVVIAGGVAFMVGQAVARTWRPMWQFVAYAALLGMVDRFLIFALFDGELLSPTGYALDTAVLIALAWVAFRSTRTYMMVTQYPWLYERAGPFSWRTRPGAQ